MSHYFGALVFTVSTLIDFSFKTQGGMKGRTREVGGFNWIKISRENGCIVLARLFHDATLSGFSPRIAYYYDVPLNTMKAKIDRKND